jgi:hypothetical protein
MSLKDFYSNSSGKEISIRDEFHDTFDGTAKEISKKQTCLIRFMRRDANGNKIPCSCVDPVTKEPIKERLCPICLGEGFLWDESYSEMYKVLLTPKEVVMPPGLTNIPLVIFYMRHNANVSRDDKLIELVLDSEGIPVQPVLRRNVFRIQHLQEYRLDEGKLEYLKLWTYEEDVKYLNAR